MFFEVNRILYIVGLFWFRSDRSRSVDNSVDIDNFDR